MSVKILALSKLAHGVHSGSGIIAIKVQIRCWPELKSVSASGQCPVFQLIQPHSCQRAYVLEEAAELEDCQIWVWGRKSVKAGLGLGLHH